MRIHVLRLHSEDRLLSGQQRPSVQNAHRRLLLDRQILDRLQLGQFRGSDGILAEHNRHVQFVFSLRRLLQLLEAVLLFTSSFLPHRRATAQVVHLHLVRASVNRVLQFLFLISSSMTPPSIPLPSGRNASRSPTR